MAKVIRTKPNPTSRATLRELAAKGVLSSSMVGIRTVIRAETSEVEDPGFDLWHLQRDRERLANFYDGFVECSAWVSYNGGRAKLDATTGKSYWDNPAAPPKPIYPLNDLASRLFGQPDTKGTFGIPSDGLLFGDAILVRDIRRHWSLCRHRTKVGEVSSSTRC